MANNNTPIVISAAQLVQRDVSAPEQVQSPIVLTAQAVEKAINGNNALAEAVDALVMTRLFNDSSKGMTHPLGMSDKPPVSVSQLTGLSPKRTVYGSLGGQTPQSLLNEFAAAIHRGEHEVAVLCGGEATASVKQALRNQWSVDWSESPEGEMEDRGFKELWDKVEIYHHMTFPPQTYALFENAWRHKNGLSIKEHQQVMGELFERFSDVAANNPYAQFPVSRSADFLARPSKENYAFCEPYNKWMIAQDAVNQAAAVIVTSVGKAKELGIDESQWVYLHGHADAEDTYISRRPDLSASGAIKAAAGCALEMANKSIDDMQHIDIYSCFPIAVLAACDALGIDWKEAGKTRPELTVTGGLPFFGGPGNNYSMHAIAEIYQRVIDKPGEYGLVCANGGFMTKESAGIYSTDVCDNWSPADDTAQQKVDAESRETLSYPYNGTAVIETYSLVYKKGTPAVGFCLARASDTGERVVAKASSKDSATLQAMIDQEPIGKSITVETGERGAYFTFA